MFPLCHTLITPISAFRDQISIVIEGCVTTWSQGSHHPSIPHNVVILQHSHNSFLILNHIGSNHCNLHLLKLLIHGPRTLIQTLQFQIQIFIIVVRHKSPSHQHFHLLPWRYQPLSTRPSTNHILIPPNQCIIREFDDYQFHFLRLWIVMALKNPIHLFLPLQMMQTSWSCGHAKTSIPGKPSKSSLIGVWHKDNLYLGTSTIENGKPTPNKYWFMNEKYRDVATKPIVIR